MAMKTLASTNATGIIETAERMADEMRARGAGREVMHIPLRAGWEKRVVCADGRVCGSVFVTMGPVDTYIEEQVHVDPAKRGTRGRGLLEGVLHRLMGRLRLRAEPPSGAEDT